MGRGGNGDNVFRVWYYQFRSQHYVVGDRLRILICEITNWLRIRNRSFVIGLSKPNAVKKARRDFGIYPLSLLALPVHFKFNPK